MSIVLKNHTPQFNVVHSNTQKWNILVPAGADCHMDPLSLTSPNRGQGIWMEPPEAGQRSWDRDLDVSSRALSSRNFRPSLASVKMNDFQLKRHIETIKILI